MEWQRADAFGQPVLELAADYQGRTNGGDGWIRLLEIDTAGGAVRVQTYSPTLDQFERDADSEFTLAAARPRLEITWTPAVAAAASAPIAVSPTASSGLFAGRETLRVAGACSVSPATPPGRSRAMSGSLIGISSRAHRFLATRS